MNEQNKAPTDAGGAVSEAHERNLSASNAELLEQALSHPPLSSPQPLQQGGEVSRERVATECSTCHQTANPAHYCDQHNGGPWCDECWKVGDCASVHGAGCRTSVWEPMDPKFSDGLDRAFLSRAPDLGDLEGLVERLEAQAEVPGYATWLPKNPDGPEAARALRSLAADRDKAVGLLRRWRSDLPSEALEDLTDAFLSSQTEES